MTSADDSCTPFSTVAMTKVTKKVVDQQSIDIQAPGTWD